MPTGQRTLTEVDGVVEIGPVGPATQKEVAPAQANIFTGHRLHVRRRHLSICERGFALMNNLKTARRSRMADVLLRTLMTICTLGKEWADPTKIPVDKIAEEWRSQSSKGRYESAMWREAGLEEPGANAANGGGIDRNVDVAEADVDNLNAGGFFARYGREPNVAPAQRSSRRTPLEGRHRGRPPKGCHRGGERRGGARGGGGRYIVIELGGGCRVYAEWLKSGCDKICCLSHQQTELWSGCLGEIELGNVRSAARLHPSNAPQNGQNAH